MSAGAGASAAEVVLRGEIARLQASATAVLILCIVGSIGAAVGAAHALMQLGIDAPADRGSSSSSSSGSGSSALRRLPADALWYPFFSL